MPSIPDRARLIAIVVAFTVLSAFRAFNVFFAVDDFSPLLRLGETSVPSLTGFFARRYLSSDGMFALVHSVVGLDYRLYHLPPLAFHAGSALLLAAIVRMACPRVPGLGLVAAVVFSIHPAAYTPLVWLSAGFNETPALFFGLLSVWCALRYVQRGQWRVAVCAGLAVVLGAAFKQPALLAPVYFVPLACIVPMPADHSSAIRIRRLAVVCLPILAFQIWYLVYVWPVARRLFTGPYEPILAPDSLMAVLGTLAAHALNPLPFIRFDIGYQGAIPSSLAEPGGLASLAGGGLLAGGMVLLSGWAAWRLQVVPVALALAAALVGGLSWATPLASHLQGYYSYFALPAASALIALPLLHGWRTLTAGHPSNLTARYAVASFLIVWVVSGGAVLHGVNRLVLQAEHARLAWQFVAAQPALSSVYFVPPTGTAQMDTVSGRVFQVMRPVPPLAVLFAGAAGTPRRLAPIEGEAMLVLDDLGTGVWKLFVVESAVWTGSPSRLTLRGAGEVVEQPLIVQHSLQALHLRARGYGRHALLRYTLVRNTGTRRLKVMEGELDLRGTGDHYLNVPLGRSVPLPAGRYTLTLRLSPDADGAAQLLLAPVTSEHVSPGRVRDPEGRVTTLDGALVHRVVKLAMEPPCVGPVSSLLGLCAR